MISDRLLWQRARPLFDELVELAPEAQQRRLEAIGRDDPELRSTVERLLAADRGAEAALREYSFGSPSAPTTSTSNSRDPLGVVGRTVSHFLVTDYVAAGGMGVVYSADDLQLGRTVALKFPLPHQKLDRAVEERFVNEAKSAASLDHPNLCTVHEIGESEHGLFLAMPLYPGETLKDRLARERVLPPERTLDIVRQVVTGLASAHAAGIVHRDLKPGNVMLLPDGTAKVLDFGLAKVRDVNLTRSRTALGTVGYVAPEQIRGGAVDARVDLWAIGVMLHEMLTGVLPFEGEHEISLLHAILNEEPRQPSRVNADVPRAFDEVIGALLQKDPRDRYPSADALLADLIALQGGSALARRTPFWRRTKRRRSVRRALLPAGVLAMLGIIVVGWDVARRDGARQVGAQSTLVPAPALKWVNGTAHITSGAELVAALHPANAGRRVRLRAGTYDIDRPLVVPDGMTLEGAGIMRFDGEGLPTGFAEGTRSVVRMTATAGGDILTLGDRATVRNLEIVELAGRSGNVVAVVSRRLEDSVSVAVSELVIVNPNPLTIGAGGAHGRGLYVVTSNHNLGSDPPPHEGSVLAVRIARSVIRSPGGGGGLFVYNFAADSRISVTVERSVIGGSNEANGGVSRPDLVHDSEVQIASRGNLYHNEWVDPCVAAERGWNLTGGSGAPVPMPLPATRRNVLRLRSVDDRIERFTTGVLATGSRRFFAAPLNDPPSDNHIDLQLVGTRFATPACTDSTDPSRTRAASSAPLRVADLSLAGSWIASNAAVPGSGNWVRAELRGVIGSGRRANEFSNSAGPGGPLPAQLHGIGNRLVIVGDPLTFARSNRAIEPRPAANFFTPRDGASPPGGAQVREPNGEGTPKERATPH